jgi:hypothetical protein
MLLVVVLPWVPYLALLATAVGERVTWLRLRMS